MTTDDTFAAVRACALAILAGLVLQAETTAGAVTAGVGKVIDWRTVRCGDEIQTGADPFDTAQLFVALVGHEAAFAALQRHPDIPEAAPFEEPPPRVFDFAPNQYGCRQRQFSVGDLRVSVEVLPWVEGDDASAAAFTERLACAAAELHRNTTA